MIITLALALQTGPSLPHVDIARILGKDQPAVERVIGHGTKQRRGPGYLFSVKGFDHFWLLGFGKEMTRIVCAISVPCTRDQALACLGLSASGASVKSLSIGSAQIATRRNCFEFTRVSGLPPDAPHRAPWKVEYEEDGLINRSRMATLRPQIDAATGPARIELIRRCYDWLPKISVQQ